MQAQDLLGNYRLVRLLGQGGMGQVWRAEHVALGRPAAVKLVRGDLLGDLASRDRFIERFRREAQATARLTSPHVVNVHDFGVSADGALWYAMELLDGLDLDSLVRRHGRQPPARVVHWLAQACDGMAEAHAQGLVHRDIKPANLFACRQGLQDDFVKLLDFGLALPLWQARDSRLTADGAMAGSPAWIAPEAAMGSADVDHRADLYGLGAVAYWLLTGVQVFEADHALKLVMHHVGSAPVPPSQRADCALPEPLEAAVLACLAKAPADRPQSAAELKARLLASVAEPWPLSAAQQWWHAHPVQADDSTPATDPVSWEATAEAALPARREQPPAPAPIEAPRGEPARQVAPLDLSLERAAAVGRLRDAFAHSLIGMAEFERRVGLAEGAREPAQLAPLVADLPAPKPPATDLARADRHHGAELVVFSGLQRGGVWHPAQHCRFVCVFGGAELDFRRAVLAPGCTEVRLVCVFGGAEITVPPGLPVVVRGAGVFGAFHKKHGNDAPPSDPQQPWLKITGAAVFGGVDIRVRERKD